MSLNILPTREAALDSVLLIVPQNGYYTGFQGLVQTEPLGIEFVAGAVSDTVKTVQIHDDRVKPGGWRDKVRKNPPDLVGIGCQYTADVPIVKQLAREVREEVGPDVPIIVGGHHIGLRPSDVFMPEVTAVVRGPGEDPFRNIVRQWASKRSLAGITDIWYQDGDGEYVANVDPIKISPHFEYKSAIMDARPKPRRDLVEEFRDGYFFLFYPRVYTVETARGCRYRCSFCSVWNHHQGEYLVESPNRTVSEIASLPSGYVNLVDDLAFSDIDGAEEMADELLRLGVNKRYWAQIRADNVWPKNPEKRKKHQRIFAKLAEAGLDMVLMGLESFDPAELKRVNKGSTVEQNVKAIEFLRSVGVKIWGAQIVFPEWDVAEFDKTIEINRKLGIEVPQFTILTPLPGTPDYQRAVESGTLLTNEPGMYDFFHSVFKTKLPLTQFYTEISRLYKETGTWAVNADGSVANEELANRAARSIFRDIKEGRTVPQAVRAFKERFEVLRNEQVHLARLAQSALNQVGAQALDQLDAFKAELAAHLNEGVEHLNERVENFAARARQHLTPEPPPPLHS
ncbi:MAG: cobalamin-dependent protein [Chloroflexi bacterium]|nr:cobalamin-dependent protein [Chloroflexota bacterium]